MLRQIIPGVSGSNRTCLVTDSGKAATSKISLQRQMYHTVKLPISQLLLLVAPSLF